MHKIKLDPDMLAVESFNTQAFVQPLGTVRGQQNTYEFQCTFDATMCYHSVDGGITCRCQTEGCTGNRFDKQCYNSLHYCEETHLRPCSTTESGNTDC